MVVTVVDCNSPSHEITMQNRSAFYSHASLIHNTQAQRFVGHSY